MYPDDCQKHETQSSVLESFCCLIPPISVHIHTYNNCVVNTVASVLNTNVEQTISMHRTNKTNRNKQLFVS